MTSADAKRLPLQGEPTASSQDDDIRQRGMLLSHRVLIATLVAAGCAYAMLRHARQMLREGTSAVDGGGMTALVMCEFTAALAAISVALY